MRIIGFDPGLVTGVSVVDVNETRILHIENHQLTGTELYDFLSYSEAALYDKVGWESFILRRGAYTSDQLIPCYVIGSLEFWNYSTGGKATFEVTPATNKSGVTDDDLRKLGLYGPEGHANRHQRDASRVIVNHLIERRNMVVLRGLR